MSTGTLLKFRQLVIKNAPTILTVAGACGVIASVLMSREATIKAEQRIAEAEKEKKGESYTDCIVARGLLESGMEVDDICNRLAIRTKDDISDEEQIKQLVADPLTTTDKAIIYAKSYLPTAVMTGASLICIFGSNHLSKARIAALASAYIASETNLKEYKEKVLEMVGKKKAREVNDEVIADKVKNNPPTAANTVAPSMSNMVDLSLWYDVTSDRYFYSNPERIRRAEIEAQQMLDKNGSVSINDIYDILGIKQIPLGDTMGWEKESSGCSPTIILEIGATVDDNDRVIGTMTMDAYPSNSWLGDV